MTALSRSLSRTLRKADQYVGSAKVMNTIESQRPQRVEDVALTSVEGSPNTGILAADI